MKKFLQIRHRRFSLNTAKLRTAVSKSFGELSVINQSAFESIVANMDILSEG